MHLDKIITDEGPNALPGITDYLYEQLMLDLARKQMELIVLSVQKYLPEVTLENIEQHSYRIVCCVPEVYPPHRQSLWPKHYFLDYGTIDQVHFLALYEPEPDFSNNRIGYSQHYYAY